MITAAEARELTAKAKSSAAKEARRAAAIDRVEQCIIDAAAAQKARLLFGSRPFAAELSPAHAVSLFELNLVNQEIEEIAAELKESDGGFDITIHRDWLGGISGIEISWKANTDD
jgi:hypothetical protein